MDLYSDKQFSEIIETKRRMFFQKDLSELLDWMDEIEHIHSELNALSTIEKQLLKQAALAMKIQAIRRKNTLALSRLCKYEQYIKYEIEYGKDDYDHNKVKQHEKQRSLYKDIVHEFRQFRSVINQSLSRFHRPFR